MDNKAQDTPAECAREARKQVALLAPGKVRDALIDAVVSDGCVKITPFVLGTKNSDANGAGMPCRCQRANGLEVPDTTQIIAELSKPKSQ